MYYVIVKERCSVFYYILKHSHTLFYSSEEHFLSDNLNKVCSCFKIVKGPPIRSLLQIISPHLRLDDIIF